MTRINLIEPVLLTDQHLVAEYKELTQVFGSLKRTLISKNGLNKKKISPVCTLNTGHVYFFYDKLKYLQKRYLILAEEMINRGYSPNAHRVNWHKLEGFPEELYNDYTPTREEKKLLIDRITFKIKQKPDYYLYKGKKLDNEYLNSLNNV